MKQFNKTSALRKIKFQKNKNTYIKRLSISLSCLILLFIVILFTFARFENSSEEYTMINGQVKNVCGFKEGYVWTFDYTGDVQDFNLPCNGEYKIELWGAAGGNVTYKSTQTNGGYGAYTSGIIDLKAFQHLYLYVGGSGSATPNGTTGEAAGGYNGGGSANGQNSGSRSWGSGGGATDVRIINGAWNNFDSLKSRIMVAAGGGGAYAGGNDVDAYNKGGAAGGLNGYSGEQSGNTIDNYYCYGMGATQTEGGRVTSNCRTGSSYDHNNLTGSFGIGGGNYRAASGGGGGYYGGSRSSHIASAGGGSSFISGYSGCNAIAASSTSTNITHTNQQNHYSGKVFTNGTMIDGKGCNWSSGSATNCGANQPQPNGTNAAGHSGNGYARITLLSTNDIIKISCDSVIGRAWTFDYTGSVQTFSSPCDGNFKIETWGASGGNSLAQGITKDTLGYGGYSAGNIKLTNSDSLYIYVGGRGEDGLLTRCSNGGYNGGGKGTNDNQNTTCGQANDDEAAGGGGGATHIANTNRGLLNQYINNKNEILIVAAGGAGGSYTFRGGSGGGFEGSKGGAANAATQSTGYSFGIGQNGTGPGASDGISGAGGGLYGGFAAPGTESDGSKDPSGGGSGYIGNSSLTNKHMTCFDCVTSDEIDTKTISNTCHNTTPTTDCAKEGNGYVKITALGD